MGSVVVEHGPNCLSLACEIFLDQGSKPSLTTVSELIFTAAKMCQLASIFKDTEIHNFF